jgi:hypothetical protein
VGIVDHYYYYYERDGKIVQNGKEKMSMEMYHTYSRLVTIFVHVRLRTTNSKQA